MTTPLKKKKKGGQTKQKKPTHNNKLIPTSQTNTPNFDAGGLATYSWLESSSGDEGQKGGNR